MQPIVTVVIATRDRAAYLGRLLTCIQQQDLAAFDCLVFDDGSTAETTAAYEGIWRKLDERFRLVLRGPNERGPGGPSRIRNRGITEARGPFVAFCDDDDRWVRNDHLSTAVRVLEKHGANLFFAAMQTAAHGKVVDPNLYAPARQALERVPLSGESDVFSVERRNMATLLRHRTLHTDTIVATRELLLDAGLYWEKTNLAEDRDLSFRLVDRASKILFRSTVIGELDVSQHVSLYRTFAEEEKALFGYIATLHSECAVRDPALRRLARAVRAWDLLELTQTAFADGRRAQARKLAQESFLLHPNMGALRILADAMFNRNGKAVN